MDQSLHCFKLSLLDIQALSLLQLSLAMISREEEDHRELQKSQRKTKLQSFTLISLSSLFSLCSQVQMKYLQAPGEESRTQFVGAKSGSQRPYPCRKLAANPWFLRQVEGCWATEFCCRLVAKLLSMWPSRILSCCADLSGSGIQIWALS